MSGPAASAKGSKRGPWLDSERPIFHSWSALAPKSAFAPMSGVKLVSRGEESEKKELNFYDIGLETGTDKV